MQTAPHAHIQSLVQVLHSRLGPTVDLAEIEAEVAREISSYSTARITAFVPILVEREVGGRLRSRHLG